MLNILSVLNKNQVRKYVNGGGSWIRENNCQKQTRNFGYRSTQFPDCKDKKDIADIFCALFFFVMLFSETPYLPLSIVSCTKQLQITEIGSGWQGKHRQFKNET